MQLLEYQHDPDTQMVDAVFVDGGGTHWHFQRVDGTVAGNNGHDAYIQYARRDSMPQLGTPAADAQELRRYEPASLVCRNDWFDLMLTALARASGDVALVQFLLR